MFHDCEECNGHGILMAREGWVRCDVCDGSGRAGHKRECACELCRPPGVSVVENVVQVRYVPRPDARAELDAWMRAGIAVTGATGDDGHVRVRPAEEGEHVIGETMTDGIGLQYVKTWPTFIDEVGDFRPFTPEESAILDAQTGPAFVRPFVASTGPIEIGNWPKVKP